MRARSKSRGYTITETMIFLAVSGFMFLVAAIFISGKQAKSEFQQGMNDINSHIQQTITDVSNGFYPSNSNFNCTAGPAGQRPSFSTGANQQGVNEGCSFIGKVMQFGVKDTDDKVYNVYTIIGRQFQTDDKTLLPPANFAQAVPVAITGLTGSYSVGAGTNMTQSQTLEWGLQADHIYDGDTAHPIGAIGIFAGFATSSNSKLASGAAAPFVVAVPGSQLDQPADGPTIDGLIDNLAGITSPTNPNIIMCFKGGADQFGRLTLGSSDSVQGQRLSTSFQISNGQPTGICPND